MYSYEDRLRAVQLYIKLGKRVGLAIRQLGYPMKNALKSWHLEYEQRLDLPAGYARQPRYSQAHQSAQGTGRRVLPRARPLHRDDDQGAGLSIEVIAVRVAAGAQSAGADTRRFSIPRTGPCSYAICRHRLVHATSMGRDNDPVGRVASQTVVVKPVVAWNEVKQSDDEGFSEVLIFPD